MTELDAGACGGCGAPYEYRDGIRRASCSTACPALFEGMAIRLQLGDTEPTLIGSIGKPDPSVPPERKELVFCAELARLLHAAADLYASSVTSDPTQAQ